MIDPKAQTSSVMSSLFPSRPGDEPATAPMSAILEAAVPRNAVSALAVSLFAFHGQRDHVPS